MTHKTAEGELRAEITTLIPQMRAFARSLCKDATRADDLTQDALAKAWQCRESYTPGTHLKAWLFRIIRNLFYSETRRSWRATQLDPGVAEATLVATADATAPLELEDVRRAMHHLPDEQREALILIAVAGLPYEEVGMICGVAVGTIKSRVSRARQALVALLAEGDLRAAPGPASDGVAGLMAEAERLRARHAA